MSTDRKKLLEDYLNKGNHITNEIVKVNGFFDYGEVICVNVEWESEESLNTSTLYISLFDLLTFVYSKL